MAKKRVLVGYGIDVDAVANWINTGDGTPQNPTNVSRGIYGATVGIDRLLKLWEKYNIRATWFTPAHTIESSIQVARFTGSRPLGYTAPAWLASKELIPQLEHFGILYDHSFMHHDVQPYYVPDSSHTWIETDHAKEASHWMLPMTKLRPSQVVEIPANWHLDDWPPLQPKLGSASGYVDTAVVEKLWKEQFDFAYREYDSFIFPISIHPQVSGKPQVILMHERLIEYINKHEGVEWMTFGQMANEFREGAIAGVDIEGGV